MTSIYKDFQPYLFISILVVGGLSIYFLLKKYSRFVETVVVNHEYIKVGEKFTLYWDSIKSYQYSNTGLLAGFIFTTIDRTFYITGLIKGPEGEKFTIMKDGIFKIMDDRASDPGKGKIMPYNFYTTKSGKVMSYITLVICIVIDLMAIYFLVTRHKKLNSKMIFDLVILGLFTIISIGRVYTNRNKSA